MQSQYIVLVIRVLWYYILCQLLFIQDVGRRKINFSLHQTLIYLQDFNPEIKIYDQQYQKYTGSHQNYYFKHIPYFGDRKNNLIIQIMKILSILNVQLLIACFLLSTTSISAQKKDLTYYLPDIEYNTDIPTPEEFLGYQVGEWHVTHDQLFYYMNLKNLKFLIQNTVKCLLRFMINLDTKH